MLRYLSLGLTFAFVLAGTVSAQQLPPGYQGVIQITNDDSYDRRSAINNHGQIVFSKRIDPFDVYTSEIYLYDNGVTIRLTDDYIIDSMPDINDAGTIVWSRAVGPGEYFQIAHLQDGQLTMLTNDDLSHYSPRINNNGLVAWHAHNGQGCQNSDTIVFVYDDQTVTPITSGGYSDQTVAVNDFGDMVWTRFNFCNTPWTSEIMMYSDGVISTLTQEQIEPRAPDINNHRLVSWMCASPTGGHHMIQLWEEGVTTTLTEWGSAMRLNNRGDMAFNRWHDDSSTWQVWLYCRGEFWQITNDPFWNCDGKINDHGDIVWHAGDPFDVDLKLLKRMPPGDVNCDGLVNAFDIDPFVLALTNLSVYELTYPECDYLLADFNADGEIDVFDIDPFVQALMH